MTNPSNAPDRDEQKPDTNSTSTRARYRPRPSSPSGMVSGPEPAPGVAGADQRQGALVRKAAAGGGPQPEGETSPRTRSPKPPSRKRSPKALPDKREHVISVRLNGEEKRLLTAAAKQTRTSLPAFLARAGLAAARDAENTAAAIAGQRELVAELFAARRNLGWAGSNLNQITKALHSGAQPEQLDAVLDAVRRAAQRVQDAANQLLRRA
jgi:uncharacterized protein (DUF1778 family)